MNAEPVLPSEHASMCDLGATHVGPFFTLTALAVLFGILILIFPRALNYLVAIYLIISGLMGLGFVTLH